eukprot:4338591-Amphidinium_carterae.1
MLAIKLLVMLTLIKRCLGMMSDIFATLHDAFTESGFVEDSLLDYEGGNPATVRSEVLACVIAVENAANPSDVECPLLCISSVLLYTPIGSRIGPRTS